MFMLWPALRISALYALFAGSWILFSDRLLEMLVPTPQVYAEMQTYKGWFFVFVTALLLFVFIRNDMAKRTRDRLSVSGELADRKKLLAEQHGLARSSLLTALGVLNVTTSYYRDESDRDMGRQCANSLLVMALAYDISPGSAEDGAVRIGPYLDKVVQETVHAHGAASKGKEIVVDCAALPIPLDRAIHLGLIVSELVSNSMKHAFPDGRKGRVELVGTADETALRIVVSDNGVGMDLPLCPGASDTLGMTIVDGLASQSGIAVAMKSDGGTIYELTVPLLP